MIGHGQYNSRYIRIISGALIAALLIYFSYIKWQGPKDELAGMETPTVLVSAAAAVSEDVPLIVNVFGSLRAIDAAMITSEINGTIAELFFTEGLTVAAGDPLIRLDDALEQAQLTQAQAELELATAQHKRLQNLLAKKAVSVQEVDEAKANLDVSAAQLEIAQAQLAKTLIKAPFAGMLGARKLSLGQYVTLGNGLVDIVDRSKLTLEYSVSERYLSEVALGQNVSLTTSAYPDEIFTGVVNFIAPQIDVATRTLSVEALVDNVDGRLSPGLSVRLMHVLGHEANGLKIPEESLLPTVEGYKVYVIQDGIANSVTVEIISRIKGFVYITQGIKAGDQVVTTGQEKLRDGAKVEILDENKEV